MSSVPQEGPLDYIDMDDVIQHGDPSKWTFRGPKPGSPVPATSTSASAVFVSFLLILAYLNCLMLNVEDNYLTGISSLTRLTAWAVGEPNRGLVLRSGRGFKLDKTPDGWVIKPMRKRMVKLSGEFLRVRGWRFDHLKQFVPVP